MKNNKGITLVELVVSIGIMGIIFLVTTSFVLFGMRSHKLTADESDVQSSLRLLSSDINSSVRNASATFTLYKENANNLTRDWDYIMVSPDKKSVLKYEWDQTQNKHIESTLLDEVEGTTFKIEYSKRNDYNSENLIGFKIIAEVNGKERDITSGLESLNSFQVIDRKSSIGPSNTIAYRTDKKSSANVHESQAAVAMVLDVSGSMRSNMAGGRADKPEDSRIYKLRKEAIRLVDGLSKNPSIYASLHPFSSTANGSTDMMNVQANVGSGPNSLTATINSMPLGSITNTGDGMRRAYYSIEKFNNDEEAKPKIDQMHTKNFIIILVDGGTNAASAHRDSPRSYVTRDGNIENSEMSRNSRDYIESGRYLNSGSSGRAYVDLIGDMIKTYKSHFNEDIKVYVIGFSDRASDIRSLKDISKASSDDNKFYEAGDETALREIFAMIQKDIEGSLWQVGGPE